MDSDSQTSSEDVDHRQSDVDHLAEVCRNSHREIELAQSKPVPFFDGITTRDFANVLVVGAFRNGFIETLHAGNDSELLADPTLSRITDLEMKKVNIETSARLAYLLSLFFEHSEKFAREFLYLHKYVRNWERQAVTFDLPDQFNSLPQCEGCAKTIHSNSWHFCPG
jgi:hypothetical protein